MTPQEQKELMALMEAIEVIGYMAKKTTGTVLDLLTDTLFSKDDTDALRVLLETKRQVQLNPDIDMDEVNKLAHDCHQKLKTVKSGE